MIRHKATVHNWTKMERKKKLKKEGETGQPSGRHRFVKKGPDLATVVISIMLILLSCAIYPKPDFCLARTQQRHSTDGTRGADFNQQPHQQEQVEQNLLLGPTTSNNKNNSDQLSSGDNQNSEAAANNLDDGNQRDDSLVALAADLMSVRGSLAFWRQLAGPSSPANGASPASASSPSLNHASPVQSSPSLDAQGSRSGLQTRRSSAQNNTAKCQKVFNNNFLARNRPSTLLQTNNNNNNPMLKQQTMMSLSNPSSWQILAVEGTHLQVNFLIVGQRLSSRSNIKNNNNSDNNNNKLRPPLDLGVSGRDLTVDWLRNGRPLDVHLGALGPNGLLQRGQTTSGGGGGGGRSGSPGAQESSSGRQRRFSQQFITSTTSYVSQANYPAGDHDDGRQSNQAAGRGSLGPDEWQQFQSFVLANRHAYLNEPLLNRLQPSELISQITSQAKSNSNHMPRSTGDLVQELKQSFMTKSPDDSSGASSEPDDFVGAANDAELINWPRTYEHFQNVMAKHHHQQQQQPLNVDCDTDQVRLEHQPAVIRLASNQLKLDDAGHYALKVCLPAANYPISTLNNNQFKSGASQANCQLVQFQLIIAPDIPKLEAWLTPELLEPGQRLSIKCQASGFTLPQISWVLDNQLISEQHQPGASSILATNNNDNLMIANDRDLVTVPQLTRIPLSSRFRIGDYVSQDNQVHSFINASHLLQTDGGFYKCQANNGMHAVESSARIDVRGPPTISRLLPNQSSLVGSQELHFQCPFSGHPISMVEWYFKPSLQAVEQQSSLMGGKLSRARRVVGGQKNHADSPDTIGEKYQEEVEHSRRAGAFADPQNQDPDTDLDQDEWLAQASAMTSTPDPADFPPEPDSWPDYPPSGLIPAASSLDYDPPSSSGLIDDYGANYSPPGGLNLDNVVQFYDSDFEQQQQQTREQQKRRRRRRRRRRDTLAPDQHREFSNGQHLHQFGADAGWVQFPQSRRHHIYPNGTLIVQYVSRDDQGQYKCRVLAPASGPGSSVNDNNFNSMGAPTGGSEPSHAPSAWSNTFHLTVLVPPVISPFGSSDSLREGMRNFLTCSVIEGDSPVRLSWLKDGQPIEEYIASRSPTTNNIDSSAWAGARHELIDSFVNQESTSSANSGEPSSSSGNPNSGRIRVETTNEFTSTLYFQHVDFRDNGNYTCMASNKAASVNYTAKMLVNVPPKWIKAPKDVECIAGQNIMIDCQAQAYPNPRVWWEIGTYTNPASLDPKQAAHQSADSNNHKQQQQLQQLSNQHQQQPTSAAAAAAGSSSSSFPPNHYRTIISNSRTHILENASLVIRDVGRHDSGHYLCQAANNFGSLSALIRLTVNVGASFVQKYSLKYVKLNENVELDCDPVGQSPVEIVWFERSVAGLSQHQQQKLAVLMGNKQLISNLTIGNIKNTANMLQAAAAPDHPSQQTINQRLSKQATLMQQQQHQSSMTTSTSQFEGPASSLGRRLFTSTIRTDLGQGRPGQQQAQAHFSSASAHVENLWPPEPTAGSLQSQKLIELDASMAFELVKRVDGSELVRMLIKQAKRSHSADYICQASNRYGTDEKLVRLLVQEPPDPVSEVSFVRVESRSISLSWAQPYSGNLPITGYTVEWRPIINNNNQAKHDEQQSSSAAGPSIMIDSSAQSGQSIHQAAASEQHQARWFEMSSQQASATINSLQPKTTYQIRVRAHNQLGVSQLINPNGANSIIGPGEFGNNLNNVNNIQHPSFIHTTSEEAPSAPPSDVRAVPLSSSSVQISWSHPVRISARNPNRQTTPSSLTDSRIIPTHQDSITGYMVGYHEAGNANSTITYKTVTLQTESGGNSDAHTIENNPNLNQTKTNPNGQNHELQRIRVVVGELKRSTTYAFHVQAMNSAGPGPQSDPIEAKTFLNDPPPAPQLRISQTTYSSIEIQWSFSFGASEPSQLNTIHDHQAPEPSITSGYHHQKANYHKELDHLGIRSGQATRFASSKVASTSPFASASTMSESQSNFKTTIDGYRLYYRLTDSSASGWIERQMTPETHLVIPSGLGEQRDEWSLVEVTLGGLHDDDPASVFEDSKNNVDVSNSTVAPKSSARISRVGGNMNNNNNRQQAGINVHSRANVKSSWTDHGSVGSTMRYVLDQLACGSSYQIYLIAYNSIGSGLPSQIVRAKTRGSSPLAPQKSKEFIFVNITSALLNLDAWQDAGCSITNFEIRYRVLRGGRNEILTPHQTQPVSVAQQQATPSSVPSLNSKSGWLLLSNNISPDQRQVELRDLEPETWYALLAVGESSSGKTEQEYRFMTLDKFGQLPAEGIDSPFPAFFLSNSNSTLRNILNNFSPTNPMTNSLLLSGSMLLIIFTSCLLFRMRHRLFATEAKDSASLDSTITGVTNYTSSDSKAGASSYRSSGPSNGCSRAKMVMNSNNNNHICLNNATHFDSPTYKFEVSSDCHDVDLQLNQMFDGVNKQQEFCQTINDELPSRDQQANIYGNNHQLLLNGSIDGIRSANHGAKQEHEQNQEHQTDQHDIIALAHKFNTLTRNQASQFSSTTNGVDVGNNRFRTMQHRPISTFIPNHRGQFSVSFCNNQDPSTKTNLTNNNNGQRFAINNEDLGPENQIYSKLRMMYNANNNYNSSPDHHHHQQQLEQSFNQTQDGLDQTIQFQNYDPLFKNQSIRDQIYNSMQQNQQSLDPALVESLIIQHQQQSQTNGDNNNNKNAFLIDCQQHYNNNVNGDGHNNEQHQFLNATAVAYGIVAPQSLSSGASTSNGSQSNGNQVATPISQISSSLNSTTNNNNNANNLIQSFDHQQHSKQANNNNTASYNAGQPQAPSLNALGQSNTGNNEQSDYALPFPPKWV